MLGGMRILLFSGKGGVGKSWATHTGNERGFDLQSGLFHTMTADPRRITGRLWIHEVNIQKESQRNWQEIWSYISSLLRTSGLNEVEGGTRMLKAALEESEHPG